MNSFSKQALAAAFAAVLICGSSAALADPGNGQDKAKDKGHGHAQTHSASSMKSSSNSHHAKHTSMTSYSGAHSCVNPARNTRGWCQTRTGGDFITGRVTAINSSNATILMSNGQTININEQYLIAQGHGLTTGQQVTLRGAWQNGVFDVNTGAYSNYVGPYSGATIRGMILSVNGNAVQIVQGLSLITINDANAVSRGAVNGALIPGRTISASGNWNGSTFFANSIQ